MFKNVHATKSVLEKYVFIVFDLCTKLKRVRRSWSFSQDINVLLRYSSQQFILCISLIVGNPVIIYKMKEIIVIVYEGCRLSCCSFLVVTGCRSDFLGEVGNVRIVVF